jgi:hypothetical protein
MRFLGPRSIASLLKTALDVVYYGLFVFVIVLFLVILCLLVLPNVAAELASRIGVIDELPIGFGAIVPLGLVVSLGGYLLITHWTRQVFSTLAEGDVFHRENTRRLRWIGFGLGGVEIFGYVARAVAAHVFHLPMEPVYGLRAVTTWFSVLVVFVLAEVFKEGARLRQEADLTI